jgi:hypothetical protein
MECILFICGAIFENMEYEMWNMKYENQKKAKVELI